MNSQPTLFDNLERQEILDKADLGDFEKDMDAIKALPEKDWWALFKNR